MSLELLALCSCTVQGWVEDTAHVFDPYRQHLCHSIRHPQTMVTSLTQQQRLSRGARLQHTRRTSLPQGRDELSF